MDPPSRVQSFYHSPMMPITQLFSYTVICHILLWIIKALYALSENTGNPPLSQRILVNLYLAISLKLLKILRCNFQYRLEI